MLNPLRGASLGGRGKGLEPAKLNRRLFRREEDQHLRLAPCGRRQLQLQHTGFVFTQGDARELHRRGEFLRVGLTPDDPVAPRPERIPFERWTLRSAYQYLRRRQLGGWAFAFGVLRNQNDQESRIQP